MRISRVARQAIAAAAALITGQARAATYDVGSGQTYAKLASLPALAPGDVVQVHAGTYHEVKRWTDSGSAGNPITIRGLGSPRPVIDATGITVDGALPNPRAVFQIEGANITVENLELVNARNGDNGAGVRVTGSAATNAVIRNCKVDQCDMGIMSDSNDNLLIDACEIANNGTASYSGYSHNLYLGGQRSTVQYSYIHDSLFGQNVKSRGHFTALLYNYIADSQDGEIGLVDATETAQPNSNAVMIGNIVVSKPRESGWNGERFVWFGQDLGGSHNGTLYAVNNTFVAGDSRIVFLDTSSPPDGASVVSVNNIFFNSDSITGGNGPLTGSNNWAATTAAVPSGFTGTVRGTNPAFLNPNARDFHLMGSSSCVDVANNGPTYQDASGASQSAVPTQEYVVELMHVARPTNGKLDLGAYEYGTVPSSPDGGSEAGAFGDAAASGDAYAPLGDATASDDAGSTTNGAASGDTGGCACVIGSEAPGELWGPAFGVLGVVASAARRRRRSG